MKKLISILILALSGVVTMAQLPAIVRNAFTTNQFNALTAGARYVDAANGSDTYSGSVGRPWATISNACQQAAIGTTIYVGAGDYAHPINMGGLTWVFAPGAGITYDVNLGTPALSLTSSLPARAETTIYGGMFTEPNYSQALRILPGNRLYLHDTTINGSFEFYANSSTPQWGTTQLRAWRSTFVLPLIVLNDGNGATVGTTNRGYLYFNSCRHPFGLSDGGSTISTVKSNLSVTITAGESGAAEDFTGWPAIYGTNTLNPNAPYP